jgi:hypothetical protein
MKWKPVDEVTAARLRRAAREGRVRIAPHEKVDEYRNQVDSILQDIGSSEALVTDESCFSHFPLEDADNRRLSQQYGLVVRKHDRISAVAERLVNPRC